MEDIPSGAVEKAAMVLEAFPPGRTAIGVTELSRRCGLAKSTTHRTLGILEAIGMVERQEAGYLLGCLIRRLADIYDGRSPSQLRDCVLPYMLDLYEETHLAVHLGVWTGGGVLIAENLHGKTDRRTIPEVGARIPVHCTALGRVLLAHVDDYSRLRALRSRLRPFTTETVVSPGLLEQELKAIRQQGLARSWNQFLPGIVDVAAPILDADGSIVAAIAVSGPIGCFDTDAAARHVSRTARAASLSPCLAEVPRPAGHRDRLNSPLQYV